MPLAIAEKIALELTVKPQQVAAAMSLLDEGATVPFIARYRKEVTGGLDDTQLRHLEERLIYLREMAQRRATIIAAISEQGKLTPELNILIIQAETKQQLEDLYLPYKQKRRTKAQVAREAGIEPLADLLLKKPETNPDTEAMGYLNIDAGFVDSKTVLEGARYILMERFAEDSQLVGNLRDYLNENGVVRSKVVAGKEADGHKFRDWFDFSEPLSTMPSHRALALLRGRNEGILQVSLVLDSELDQTPPSLAPNPCEQRIANRFGIQQRGRAADKWLNDTVRWTWRVKLSLHLELDLIGQLRERAEDEAIRIFGKNLNDLLLAAPAGKHITLGIDPGIRTGCKIAVVDATGKLLETATIYPHEPRNDWIGASNNLAALIAKHHVTLVAIGNGTASRETDKLVTDLLKQHPTLKLTKLVVSEAGASVYSASELAAREFPDLDVSLRGAVSIARRLQDPLAELVKIEPKSIGVGQYQHDVSQLKLARSLDAVVEDCVNAVGVDVNTASAPLLTRISGLNASLAANIVSYRDSHGAFKSREELLNVPRLGEKTFEQAAGFLRIRDGNNPLDASSVHPEAYPIVEKILADLKQPMKTILGNPTSLRPINASKYTDERFGLPTVQDILKELEKPGHDPRPEFRTAHFSDQVTTLKDLMPGMLLEGVITNVAAFGAFVDIGVHQDGLVHISALSNTFVKDPHSIVKAGQIVRVKVLEVDLPRSRIALSLRLTDDAAPKKSASQPAKTQTSVKQTQRQPSAIAQSAMANAFAKLKQ